MLTIGHPFQPRYNRYGSYCIHFKNFEYFFCFFTLATESCKPWQTTVTNFQKEKLQIFHILRVLDNETKARISIAVPSPSVVREALKRWSDRIAGVWPPHLKIALLFCYLKKFRPTTLEYFHGFAELNYQGLDRIPLSNEEHCACCYTCMKLVCHYIAP
jgi:hypothetical protein